MLHSLHPTHFFLPLRLFASCAPAAGSDSQSGVADQPFGDEETLRGAYNRVASIAMPQHSGSLLVAIEGGVGLAAPAPPCFLARQGSGQQQQRGAGQVDDAIQQQQQAAQQEQQLEVFAWVVVQAPGGATSHARSASFPLPAAVSELILRQGLELGQADDKVFGRQGRLAASQGWEWPGLLGCCCCPPPGGPCRCLLVPAVRRQEEPSQ